MKGNPKQDDPIQNLHDAGCSQQIIEQFMQSRKEGTYLPNTYSVKQRNLLLKTSAGSEQAGLPDYLLFN
ncbi:MAG: hypothetical protein ACLSHC_05325 [Bilophila wadsworthia]